MEINLVFYVLMCQETTHSLNQPAVPSDTK